MPPKINFSRESIISAAFELVEERGVEELSARKVAEKLQSSQAPIYTQFKNIEELKTEVFVRSKKLLFEYINQEYTEKPFLNIGVGISIFSREHKNLFQAMSNKKEIMLELFSTLTEKMMEDPRFTRVSSEKRRSILDKMAIATFGLVELMAKGLMEDTANEKIIQTLNEIGSAVIKAEFNMEVGNDE
jgi:AcrR family transcriptional regulator